jgi:hypothetical protein
MRTKKAGAVLSALLYAQCLFGVAAVGAVLYKHSLDVPETGVVQAVLPVSLG